MLMPDATHTLAVATVPAAPLSVAELPHSSPWSDEASFVLAMRMAKCLSASSIVPDTYRGEQNIGSSMIALEMANRMRIPLLEVFQNLHIIHGRPSWSSTFIISRINSSGKFSPLSFRLDGAGDDRGCVAFARRTPGGEPCESVRITIALAKAEGWATKAGSKWRTMPDQMLQYRAAAFFARAHAPELLSGVVYTQDEIIDVEGAPVAPPRIATARSKSAPVVTFGKPEIAPEPAAPAEPAPEGGLL
jgi:hypothetical protein